MAHPRILFVLADGARARFVQRIGQTPRFATFETVSHEGAAPADFLARVAMRTAALCRAERFASLAVAAPPKLIGPLRDRLASHARVVHAWPQDLTKTPDAELPRWFAGLPPL